MTSAQQPVLRPSGETSVLLFDFGGTLDSDGVSWKERFFRLCRQEGIEVAPERFDRVFYAADDRLVGNLPVALSFRQTVERLAEGLAEGLELEGRARLMAERLACRFVAEALERLAGSAELLGRLSRRYRLGVISNFYGNLAGICEETGLSQHLSVAIDSAMVGCSKPDPRIFLAALRELGAKPADAVFIGDSPSRDMAGARGVGMPHIWLAREGSNGAACCAGDRVIHRLAQLQEIFL